ncbi:multiple sugar transport system ATP-binding protein [Aequitasia blattaphilus]|uniref:ABC transporter ATP-binding protein n=1 Tax=Aequitasia blattaphilus TaxID=2949332 RepID=A0ABT1EBJ0_9FIRM|nr:ABC transporter ATP-binding protein [Aequitasia blattaphilus]MCP1103046.1 ABC transporter ATP-binding protein [Aequitasia blattaphilus]MCR8615686.1 ABC transporter ATP-binding protein [Aequitasia blattaphilus]
MAQLVLKNVFKRYEHQKKNIFEKKKVLDFAVKDVSYTCEDGEFIGILGPSGCGKSTTLRMVAGLESITNGEMYIGDVLINDLLPKDRNIGLAFEDYALYPPLSVYENLAFNMRAKNKSEEEIKQAIDYVAPLMKIDDLLNEKPTGLSGGQKQRVNIARAIVRRPGLLLLDEPLSHLDGKMRQQLRQEIKRMHHEIKCTTIIVTHDQMEAMSLADRIIIMKDGEVQQIGTPLEVYDNPENEFVAGFIGEPPMNLMKSTIVKSDKGFMFTFENSELKVEVPKRYTEVVRDGMKITLGVRPVDVIIAKTPVNSTPVPIAIFENLGDERRISVRVGDMLLSMTTAEDVYYTPGEEVQLIFQEERTHLFDPETGERIRPRGEQ